MMHHKQQQYILIGLVVVAALVLVNLSGATVERIKLAVGGLLTPLFGLASSAQQAKGKALDSMAPRGVLVEELRSLRRENRELRVQLKQLGAVRMENANLRKALGWREGQEPWNLQLARVIGRDPSSWWHTLQIDLGANQGVAENFAVLSEDGNAVGKVISVGASRSQVALIGDSHCKLTITVLETQETGFLMPSESGVLDPQIVDLKFLPGTSYVQPGHQVVTSAIGSIFPAGITVGQIIDRREVGGLFTEARVKLKANLSQLERVWVKLP